MPSALLSPWKNGYGKKLFTTFNEAIVFIAKYETAAAYNIPSMSDGLDGISRFESGD